jgi:hypothetical protein
MRCQSRLTIYGSDSKVFVPGCGEKPQSNYQPASGIPVREKWAELACGIVNSVTLEPGEYRSTPLGSASQRVIVCIQNNKQLAQVNLKQSLFAKISTGIGWSEIEGAVDDVLRLGALLRLIINPANLSAARGLCNQ